MKKGLEPIERRVPYVFVGAAVREFIKHHNKPRQKLRPGEIYCVACKRAIAPAGDTVDYAPLSATSGNFIGTCPTSFNRVWRRVRRADITAKAGHLTVRYEDGSATLNGTDEPPRTEHSEGAQP
ncbi:MAG: hypothetical protein ABIT09_12380 [Croceibacterium sp.]